MLCKACDSEIVPKHGLVRNGIWAGSLSDLCVDCAVLKVVSEGDIHMQGLASIGLAYLCSIGHCDQPLKDCITGTFPNTAPVVRNMTAYLAVCNAAGAVPDAGTPNPLDGDIQCLDSPYELPGPDWEVRTVHARGSDSKTFTMTYQHTPSGYNCAREWNKKQLTGHYVHEHKVLLNLRTPVGEMYKIIGAKSAAERGDVRAAEIMKLRDMYEHPGPGWKARRPHQKLRSGKRKCWRVYYRCESVPGVRYYRLWYDS